MQNWNAQRTGDVLHTALLIALAVSGVCFTYTTPALTAALMAAVLAVALWRWHEPLDFLLAASGFMFGPVMEFFATQSGLWHYPYPSVGTLPAWVFTLWPAFPIPLVRLTHALLPPAGPSRVKPLTELALGLGILLVEIPLLCLLGTDHAGVATAGTVLMLVPAFVLVRSPQAGLMLFISGVIGPFCESFPIMAGAWSYPHPFLLGMPMWLPTGYALFGFALVRVAMGAVGLVTAVHRSQLAEQR